MKQYVQILGCWSLARIFQKQQKHQCQGQREGKRAIGDEAKCVIDLRSEGKMSSGHNMQSFNDWGVYPLRYEKSFYYCCLGFIYSFERKRDSTSGGG